MTEHKRTRTEEIVDLEGEEWRPSPVSPERYKVSNKGRVQSLTYGRWNLMQGKLTDKGYRIVGMLNNGKRTPVKVHRLVATAFYGPQEGLEVRHLDGDKLNNTVENLAWGTRSDNELDKIRQGRNKNSEKTHCPHGHEYTPENIRWRADGRWRSCRTCDRREGQAVLLQLSDLQLNAAA